MSRQIDPRNTWALVVGIDQYKDDSIGALHHQVEHALQMTKWLLDRGVPAAQIFLAISPAPNSQTLIPEKNGQKVHVREPKEDALWQTLNDEISNIAVRQGMLFVYWSGHGLIGGDDRALVCSDATAERLRSLNLNNLLFALRTDTFSCTRQVVIVDSCATHFPNRDKTNPRTFSAGNLQGDNEQFVLYSAGDAEAATDGLFSAFVMDWLVKKADASWPPDLEVLAKAVKDHFSELRKRGELGGNQTPFCIRHRAWQGEEDDLFGSLVGASERVRLIYEVREQAMQLPLTTADWQKFFAQTKRYLTRSVDTPQERNQMIGILAGFENKEQHPLFEFIWRAGCEPWARAKVNDGTWAANLSDRMQRELQYPSYFLLIELHASGSLQRPLAKEFRWWLWDQVQERSLEQGQCQSSGMWEDLRPQVIDLVKDKRTKHSQQQLQLEFFVLSDHLSTDFDHWDFRGSPLGANFPVVVRPADREHHDCAHYVNKLRASKHYEYPALQWLPDKTLPKHKISPHFTHECECRALFGFSALITSGVELSELFDLLLDCGVPFLVWPRKKTSAKTFKPSLTNLVAQGPLDTFPKHLKNYRAENEGLHLTLFWDDPARVPVKNGLIAPE